VKRPTVLLLFLALVALMLRGWDLDVQSLWSDEGLSLYRARLPVQEILTNTITVDGVDTQDTNPPLYFLLLHFWRELTGESVFALRYLGALMGVLAVPLAYALGTRALGRRAGTLAALLMALSPMHVWQSQEMRNYSMLLVWNLLSVYGLARFTLSTPGERRWPWLAVWGLAGLAGIYTHFFGFFVLAFGAAYLVLLNLKRRWLWIALAVCAVAVVPILPVATRRFLAGQQVDFVVVPVKHLISHATSVYSVGMRPSVVQPGWRVIPVVGLAVLGLVLGLVKRPGADPAETARRRLAAGLLVGYQVIPLGIMVALSLINPLYNGPRHLLIGLPPFLILAAGGLALPRGRWQMATAALGLALLVSQSQWLVVQFTSPDLVKDDVQGAAEYLNQIARPDDVIVLHDSLIQFVFDYYYTGAAPWHTIPAYGEQDPAAAIGQLEVLGRQTAGRIWFLSEPRPRSGFPRDDLTGWTSEHWLRFADHGFEWLWLPVELEGYLPHPVMAELEAGAEHLEVGFTGGIRLVGRRAAQQTTAGEPYGMTTYWATSGPQADDLTLSLRLVDPAGVVWGQWEVPMMQGLAPSEWPVGQVIRAELEITPPVGLPPGPYEVRLRLLDGNAGSPRATEGGTGSIQLVPALMVRAPAQAPPAPHLGSPIALVSHEWPDAAYRPGHPLPLDLTWAVRRRPAADYQLRIQLVDEAGQVVLEKLSAPVRDDYPPTEWQPGQTLLTRTSVTVPPQSAGGTLAVAISLLDPVSGAAVPIQSSWWPFGSRQVELGEIEIVPWPLETMFPAMERTCSSSFGQPAVAKLGGYDLDQTADELALTLYWQASAVTESSWVVFAHLTDAAGEVVSQGDGLPAGGVRPTTTWRPGEVISDRHVVSLQGVPEGIYTLQVGLYSGEERLPAFRQGEPWPKGEVVLETIEVAR
jgi:mannosyltransferase